jgi:hypothetical protein
LRLTAQEQAEADNSREGRTNCTFFVHNINYIDQNFLCNQKIKYVCEIFYWRDVTACFTMTYDGKDFDIFVILFER